MNYLAIIDIIKKLPWKEIFYGIIALVVVLLFIENRKDNTRIDQLNNNITNLTASQDSLRNNIYYLTLRQIRELYPKIDSIARANGIKPKHITNVINTHYHNAYGDTIIFKNEGKQLNKPFFIDTNCFKIQGVLDTNGFKIFRMDYNDNINAFYYKQRKTLFRIFGNDINLGKQEIKLKIVSDCGDSLNVININRIK